MKITNYLFTAGLSFGLMLNVAEAQKAVVNKELAQAMEQASPAQLKTDITYLADDKLKGRQPGTEGYQMAADYVISRMKVYGVQPAGDAGGWLQQVKLRKALIGANAEVIITKGTSGSILAYGKDVTVTPSPAEVSGNVNAPVTLLGYVLLMPGKTMMIIKGLM